MGHCPHHLTLLLEQLVGHLILLHPLLLQGHSRSGDLLLLLCLLSSSRCSLRIFLLLALPPPSLLLLIIGCFVLPPFTDDPPSLSMMLVTEAQPFIKAMVIHHITVLMLVI